jgi:antitoxin FitA
MAVLNIRNLPEDVHAKLRVRAAQHGRSMEAEAREILAAACRGAVGAVSGDDLQSLVARLYKGRKPSKVVDDLIRERRREAASE